MYTHYDHCHRATTHLQLNIINIIIIVIIINFLVPPLEASCNSNQVMCVSCFIWILFSEISYI
jgi:hypothetical protein